MKIFALLTAVMLTIVITSCDETKKVIDVAGNVQLSGTYSILNIGGKTVTTMGDKKPYITFLGLDKTIRGNTGCNSYFGKYALDLYALSFSDVGQTEMYCDEGTMATETKLMEALRNTGSYSIDENKLTLFSKMDRSVLLTANKDNTRDNN
jgi:heat shock protein HslJ